MSATSVLVVGSLLVIGLSILVREVYQLVCGTLTLISTAQHLEPLSIHSLLVALLRVTIPTKNGFGDAG